MNSRKLLYAGVAALGLTGLATYAFFAHRAPQSGLEHVAKAGASPTKSSGQQGGSVPVDTVTVIAAGMVDEINAVGTIRSNQSVMLRPEMSGRIVSLNFTDGQPVKKGQLLVAFDAAVSQAEVQQAAAELEIARANFNRNADLARQKFISDRARDESAANVQVLEAKLALARARLSKFELRAPFSGIVGIRNVSVGDYVKDGADLVNLEDISKVMIDFRVPEKYADLIRRNQLIEMAVDALPGKIYHARVDAIDPRVDSAGRATLLRARVDNEDAKLKPGMFARVRLIMAERKAALVVPEEALVPQERQTIVWKVVDGMAMQTEVRTGLRRDGKVEIHEGLNAGDTVVVAGQLRLSKNGTPVRIMASDSGLTPGAAGAPVAAPLK